jgi:hypothetical protein
MTLLSAIFLTFFITPNQQNWSGITVCGSYQVSGIVRAFKSGLVMVVNEKTQSEIVISVPIPNEAKLAPYLDKSMLATVAFVKKPQASHYQAVVQNIAARIPNPLSPKDSGIKILSEAKCQE